MIDYGLGDMVASIFGVEVHPLIPTRPVMVCSLQQIPGAVCDLHGQECGCFAVHFVDWPEPPQRCVFWAACTFKKVIEPGEEVNLREPIEEPA